MSGRFPITAVGKSGVLFHKFGEADQRIQRYGINQNTPLFLRLQEFLWSTGSKTHHQLAQYPKQQRIKYVTIIQ